MAKNRKKAKTNTIKATRNIVPKAMARTRSDVMVWKNALSLAQNPENPKYFPYYNLVADMMLDAHATSQINNRKLKSISANFSIKKPNGEVHEDLTGQLQKSAWFSNIISHILDSQFFGYTLIELDRKEGESQEPTITLVPRQNVIPQKGIILKDYSDDKGIDYINAHEYGTWLLDFGNVGELGLINKAIPHILFSRFAQSCWSELCEIYGIPPRVMKTNTQDPAALRRAERMLIDMGAAAWFIIDETENFEFANTGQPASGEVYNGLINLCRENISLLFSGAMIGQDTKFGTQGKEKISQDMLQELVNADQTLVEQMMNTKVLPALYAIGVLPEDGLYLEYDQVDDIGELWTRTKEILPYKEVDDEWIKQKFGIEVTGTKTPANAQTLSLDFFD
ncbi:phage portal protein family protein [Riemerella anatipestifer]